MDLLARTVTTPSGATTLVEDSVAAIIPHRAQGYVWSGSAYYNSALSNSSYKIPGGGLAGTAGDLGRFAAALMRGELVSEGSMEAMWTAQTLADGSKTTYGLGWNVAEYDGRREVSHGGSQQRVRTFLALVPEEKVAVAVMCNLERINPKPFGWTLVRLVLGDAE